MDNTVGSFQVIGKKLMLYKQQLNLSGTQIDVLIGSILGDANLRIIKKEATLTIAHGASQKDYVFWMYDIFRNWVLTPPREEKRIYYKDLSRKLISWRFQTVSHPILTEYYKRFYPEGKKIVPDKLIQWLTPLALAVWFMDDGSRKTYGKGAFLHTQNFSLSDQLKLIGILKEKFELETSISSHGWSNGKQLFRIYIKAKSYQLFKSIVSPYILSGFAYKLR